VSSYAEGSSVPITRSIGELDKLVAEYGATGFAYGRDDTANAATVMFRIGDRTIRFRVAKPDVEQFRRTPSTKAWRTPTDAQRHADAEERRRWRAVVLVVKALLVAVHDGIITLSDAFLAFTVLPNGQSTGEYLAPQLDTIYASNAMPPLLPGTRAAIES
jgi:hypothetical protein